MKKLPLHIGLLGLLLGSAAIAQDRDPASPAFGNKERGRLLLSILGPKPHDAAGISPLQQQELNRRVRCAATRQEIQDQLDFEAAGSPGFYGLAQLRMQEKETCTSVTQQAAFPQTSPQPVATYRPPLQRSSPTQPPVQQFAPAPPRPAPQPAPPPQRVQQPVPLPPLQQQSSAPSASPQPPQPQPPPQPARPVATEPAYTPVPDYPDAEKTAGHEGIVLVHFVFKTDGSVESATVKQSSKFEALDAAALSAARTWRVPSAAGKTLDVPLIFSAN